MFNLKRKITKYCVLIFIQILMCVPLIGIAQSEQVTQFIAQRQHLENVIELLKLRQYEFIADDSQEVVL